MEAAHGSTDLQRLREVIGKFRDGLTQEDTWECVQHLFVPDADKDKILKAIARCHVASFEPGNKYLSWRKGQAHSDCRIQYLLEKLTSEARNSMLKDLPVLIREPKLADNASLRNVDLPPVVLTLSEIGLRLPLDQRHAGNDGGDGGLRQHETDQLLARIQKEAPKQIALEPDGVHTQPVLNDPGTHTDHWLTERLQKFEPSYSARRDNYFSLNGKAEIDGRKIVCRHIALVWEKEFLGTTGKPTYQTLNSPIALQNAAGPLVRSETIDVLDAIDQRVDRAQYWMSSDWGRVLSENFDAMARQVHGNAAVCRTLYLMTPNHVMALGLKIKDRAGARRYVVQFYDPNRTVSHQRSAISATPGHADVPAEIRILRPDDFLSEYLQQHYLMVDAENRPIPTIFFGEKEEAGMPRFGGDLPDLNEHVMYLILTHNLQEQLHAYADQLKSNDDITRLKILTTKGYGDLSGLFLALDRGHTEVVEALGEILKACDPPLSPEQLAVQLLAKSSAGDPGLFVALKQGNTATVKAFGKLLKTCAPPLSSEQLMVLLTAKNGSGVPGLYAALYHGHNETVAAFGEILKTCLPSLSAAQLMDLLSADNGSGITGLHVTLEKGHTATTAAFVEILQAAASRLTPEQLLDLLQPRLPNGCPSLYYALQTGDAQWIRAYGKLLETVSASLPTKQFAKLLASKSDFARSTLQSVPENGHVEATAAFKALRTRFAPHASARQRVGQAVRLRVRKWILKIGTAWNTKN